MRYHNVIISIVLLLLAAITLTGSAFTSDYSQAARAETIGFDALAHDLFDVCADDKPELAEVNAP